MQITLRIEEKEQRIIDYAKVILGQKKNNPAICHIINDWMEMRGILADEMAKRSEDVVTILYLERRVESLLNRNAALARQIEEMSHPV